MNFEAILDILFPPECLACRKALNTGTLCDECRSMIGAPPAILIKSMDRRRDTERENEDADDDGGDTDDNGPGRCYFLAAAGSYEDHVLKSLIHALKFGGIRGAALPLASILARRARSIALPLRTFIVIPMPLSKPRLRERGFNQSALIAKPFAALIGVPFMDRQLVRVRHRKPQSRTESLAERRENIRGCFAIRENAARGENKNIILVDDVSTSGSTFAEAARVLAANGAEIILALAVAKA